MNNNRQTTNTIPYLTSFSSLFTNNDGIRTYPIECLTDLQHSILYSTYSA